MSDRLSSKNVEAILAELKRNVRREECETCDCLQGFLTQLEMDAEPAAAELIEPLKVPASRMHGCLGCDPCPPAAAFADYLRSANQQAGSTACCEGGCSCKDQKERRA